MSISRSLTVVFIALSLSALALICGCFDETADPPVYGVLEIRTVDTAGQEFPGASITIRGEDTGDLTPQVYTRARPGHYVVLVQRDYYRADPESAVVEMSGGARALLEFTLEVLSEVGAVRVEANVESCLVAVNSSETGEKTPHILSLGVFEDYTVSVSRQGFEVDSVYIDGEGHAFDPESPPQVTVLPGVEVQLLFTLSPNPQDRTTLAELCTAIWCTFCPYADAAMDSLLGEYTRDEFVLVDYHDNNVPIIDPFGSPSVQERIVGYYEVFGGLPTALICGSERVVGASTTEIAYNSYKGYIETFLQQPPPVAVYTEGNAADGEVAVTVIALEEMTSSALALRAVVYEDSVWYEGSVGHHSGYYSHVAREVVHEEEIELSGIGDLIENVVKYTIDQEWQTDHLKLVVFVQDDDTEEVVQARLVE